MKKYNNGLVFNFSNDVNKKYVVLDSIEKNDDTYLFCAPMGNEDSIRYEDGIILKMRKGLKKVLKPQGIVYGGLKKVYNRIYKNRK